MVSWGFKGWFLLSGDLTVCPDDSSCSVIMRLVFGLVCVCVVKLIIITHVSKVRDGSLHY